MFIVATSTVLAYLIAINQIPNLIVGSILSITHSKVAFFLILNLVLLIAGYFPRFYSSNDHISADFSADSQGARNRPCSFGHCSCF